MQGGPYLTPSVAVWIYNGAEMGATYDWFLKLWLLQCRPPP